jgi:hypothetical protein
MVNDGFSVNFMMDWDGDWDGKRKRQELGLKEFSNQSSFHEFPDESLLSSLCLRHKERRCQEDGKDDSEDSHFDSLRLVGEVAINAQISRRLIRRVEELKKRRIRFRMKVKTVAVESFILCPVERESWVRVDSGEDDGKIT